jgi:hypothetical protein
MVRLRWASHEYETTARPVGQALGLASRAVIRPLDRQAHRDDNDSAVFFFSEVSACPPLPPD